MTSDVSRVTAYEIVHALGKLDRRLEQAVSVAQATYGPEALADSFRGLHITQLEVGQLLARNPAEPLFAWEAAGVPADARIDCLDWLAETFGLSAFELDVLLIGLAPELDPRYERIYAFLQDDVARRRPSVDLALNLLCQDVDAKLSYRAAFASDAPLVSQRLINLFSDANQVEPSLLARSFKVDDQIVRLLLGHSRLDGRLASVCQLREPQPESAVNGELEAMAQAARADDRPLRLVFQGLDGAAQREAAEQLADAVACRLLSTDVSGLDIGAVPGGSVPMARYGHIRISRAVAADGIHARSAWPGGRAVRAARLQGAACGLASEPGARACRHSHG